MAPDDQPVRRAVNVRQEPVLPDITSDERDESSARDQHDREQWLRENVPPHHR